MITVNVILGSTREISIGRRLFKYLEKMIAPIVSEKEEINFKFITLDQYNLPFFYEDIPPVNNSKRNLNPNEQQWVNDMKNADGYLFLTPEYNHGIPAVLKNAIDFLALEASGKPAKIISYADSMRAGQIAAESLKPILQRLNIFTLPMVTSVGKVTTNFTPDGFLAEDAPSGAYYQKKLLETLHEIGFYSKLFAENPYFPFND